MKKNEMLGSLPAVDEVLQCVELSDMRKSYSHAIFVQWVRVAIQQVRSQILSGHVPFADDLRVSIVQHVRELGQSDKHRTIGTVINATGIILHTNLGRAPLSSLALERMRNASAYTNLEFDLESGKRCRRAARLEEMLSKLTGAEDAMVVNNCAAATILVLQTLAFGLEVIISRGQMVEIGGGFRLPDVFRIAGVILREVGTTNRTYCRDYEEAIGPNTGAIIRVHHSNFGQVGFVTSPELKEIVAIERRNDLPIIDDLGSGNLYDLSKYGLNEPTVIDSLKAGTDLCLFSGDKLFGGPQCGIIVGKSCWLHRLRASPMMRALRTDKITLAALEATVENHFSGMAFKEVPVLRMLSKTPKEIEGLRQQLLSSISERVRKCIFEVDCESQVGGGSLPSQSLPSRGIAIRVPHVDRLAKLLRLGTPAILGHIADQQLVLDLRTVNSQDLESLAFRINDVLSLYKT